MVAVRRVRIACAAVLLAAVACSSNGSDGAADSSTSQAQTNFALEVASSDLYVGEAQRVDVGIYGSTDQGVELLTGGSIPLSLVSAAGGDPISGTATYVPAPGTQVPTRPSLTPPSQARGVYQLDDVTFPSAGQWQAQLSFAASGQPINLTDTFEVADKPALPAPGQAAIPSKNLTMASKGVRPESIDSRAQDGAKVPDPELHQATIAAAVAEGRTALVLFATPVYCTSRFCGPTTDELEQLARTGPQEVDYIHVEIWNEHTQNKQVLNTAAADWLYRNNNLTEPWLYLIGPDGKIVDRWSPLFDPVEVKAELEKVAG